MPMKKRPGKKLTRKPKRAENPGLLRLRYGRGKTHALMGIKPSSCGKSYLMGYKRGLEIVAYELKLGENSH